MKKIVMVLCMVLSIGLLVGCEQPKEEPQKETKVKRTGIFKDYYEDAEELVSKMTLEEKVGQLFLVRYNKTDVTNFSNYYPGGYILFAKDFQNNNKESMKEEIKWAQSKNKYGLILGVDEEGGDVIRVSRFNAYSDKRYKSPRSYYEEGGYDLLEKMENEKLGLLKELGLNLNLAPVADISTDPEDFIYNRSFRDTPEATSTFIENMVKYANNNKINSCLKHFPGYGNNKDTHTGIAIDERSYEEFEEKDYKPFIAGIQAGVPSILVSHNVVKCMDPDYPASLSKKVIKELRDKLSFTGIIMTDDLEMDAVKSYVENGEAATLAVNAGMDMIITSNFEDMKDEIIQSVKDKKIKEETINQAVTRIIAWKYYSGILEK